MGQRPARQMSLIARPRILVTGFGPFPGVPENPTADMVRSLPRRLMGLKVHYRVLPVSWSRSSVHLSRAIDLVVPHLVLMCGVSNQESCARLEMHALNRLDGRPDDGGELLLPGPINPVRPMSHKRPCHWPVEDLVKALRGKGHDALCSKDPGRYLCNHTFYSAFDAPAPAGIGFLHVAPGPFTGRKDPRRRLLADLIHALDLWLRT